MPSNYKPINKSTKLFLYFFLEIYKKLLVDNVYIGLMIKPNIYEMMSPELISRTYLKITDTMLGEE